MPVSERRTVKSGYIRFRNPEAPDQYGNIQFRYGFVGITREVDTDDMTAGVYWYAADMVAFVYEYPDVMIGQQQSMEANNVRDR